MTLGQLLSRCFNNDREIGNLKSWINHVDQHGFTVSGGVSEFRNVEKLNPERLLKVADEALETAKKQGRNNVSIAEDGLYS